VVTIYGTYNVISPIIIITIIYHLHARYLQLCTWNGSCVRVYNVEEVLWLQFMEHEMLYPILLLLLLLLLLLIWWRSCPRSARTKPQLHVFSSNCQLNKLLGILRSPTEGQAITSRKKLGYLLPFLFTRAHQWSPSQTKSNLTLRSTRVPHRKTATIRCTFFAGSEPAGDSYIPSTVPDHAWPRIT